MIMPSLSSIEQPVIDGGAREVVDNGEDNNEHSDRSQLINTGASKRDKTIVSLSPSLLPDVVVSGQPPSGVFRCSRQWRYVNGIVAISSLGSFMWGYSFSVIGGAMLLIDDHFDLNVMWHEAIVTMLVIGATIGAGIAGTLSDKFGRWKVMMLSAILYGVGAVVMAFAFSEVFLVIGRTIGGLALGLYSVTGPVYVSEMAPSHIRGRLGLMNYLMTGGGVFSGCIAAGLFSIDSQHAYTFGWRYMLGLALVPSLFMCGGLCFLFETPRWLVFHGKLEKARKVMEKIRIGSAIEEELLNIQKDYERHLKNKIGTIKFIKQVLQSKTLLHALFIGCSIQTLSVFCGISTVIAYSSTLLEMVGFSVKEAIWFAALPTFLNLAAKIVSAFIIEKIGRRKLFITSGSFVVLFLSLLATFLSLHNNSSPSAVPFSNGGKCDYSNCGTCVTNSHCGFCTVNVNGEYLYGTCSEGSIDGDNFSSDNNTQCIILNDTESFPELFSNTTEWHFDYCPDNNIYAILSLVTVMLLMLSTSAGFVPVPWLINSEIYPTWARGQAASLSSLFKWLTNVLVLLTFLSMVDSLGLPQVMVIYAVLSFIGVIFVFLLLPETSNQPLEKIERLFDRPYFLTWRNPCACGRRKDAVKYSAVELHQQGDIIAEI